ncbi:hypothetical protein [Anaerosporobacter faecicola]|uniref:hypothetical protein n=1 Tax=Anaerosporobacter faecicola TaxID=2718714 RepID=UPI00143A57C6|nr:hypothetical protein [Anaerosporobacter faecicola]
MNVIEVMKQILTDYPNISDFINGEVHIDLSEEADHDYGLSSTNDNLVKKDILGNQTRENNMVLYATNQSVNDYDRLQNSTFLLDLGYYLDDIKGHQVTATINDKQYTGEITKFSIGNGMPWTKSEDGQYITYQLQIKVTYTLEREE